MPEPRRRGDERGGVLVFVAIAMVTLVGFTSFAIDLGLQRVEHRDLQRVADVVSLDLARRLDGSTASQLLDPSHPSGIAFLDAIDISSDRNDYDDLTVDDVDLLIVELDAAGDEYVVLSELTDGATLLADDVPNAVRVTTDGAVDYLFRPGNGDVVRDAIAMAGEEDFAWSQVGSFLAGVNPATDTFIGAILAQVIPGADLLSYQGLASTGLTLEALGLNMPLGVMSPDQLLNTQISYHDFVVASANALTAGGGNTAAINVLNGLIPLAPTVPAFTLGEVLGVDATGGMPAGSVTVDVLQILTSSALLIDTDHGVTATLSGLGIPGVGDVEIGLTLIEGPRLIGPFDGDSARTSQFELTVTPTLSVGSSAIRNLCAGPPAEDTLLGTLLSGVLSLVGCLLGPVNELVTIDVNSSPTFVVSSAGATVTQTILCDTDGLRLDSEPVPLSVVNDTTLNVRATVAGRSLGDLVRAHVHAGAVSAGAISPQLFSYPTEFTPPTGPRRVGSIPVGLANLLDASVFELHVLRLDLGTLASSLLAPVQALLNNLLAQLDAQLVGPIADMLGLSIGGTDLSALDMNCDLNTPLLVE
ncbi:MAG: pilus assembly protein TadG-related protein [Acidimicrobiales bacterium]